MIPHLTPSATWTWREVGLKAKKEGEEKGGFEIWEGKRLGRKKEDFGEKKKTLERKKKEEKREREPNLKSIIF